MARVLLGRGRRDPPVHNRRQRRRRCEHGYVARAQVVHSRKQLRRFDQLERFARRVVARRAARSARRRRLVGRRKIHRASEGELDLLARDRPGTQQPGHVRGQIEDRRFDPDRAGAAIQDQVDQPARSFAKVGANVFGAGRTDVSESVGARRRNGAARIVGLPAKRVQQRLGPRMRWASQAHRWLRAGELIVRTRASRDHQRQRARPKAIGQLARSRRKLARPDGRRLQVRHVHDHRMIGRTSLGLEDRPDRKDVIGVGSESVNRFGRERDELSIPQHTGGARDRAGVHRRAVHRTGSRPSAAHT